MTHEHDQAADMQATLRQLFNDVHDSLQAESGYGLDAQTREDAWRQVQLYWTKLHQTVASRVTETEVPLTLMNNESAGKRMFTIHGVVDVVEEQDQIILYDIKSHDYQRLHDNIESYGPQLQVYAHIWSELRGQSVEKTCIINTDPPPHVKAIQNFAHMTDAEREGYEKWNPIIEITSFSAERVQETIKQFGLVVDAIEERRFAPPTKEELEQQRSRYPVPLMCAKCDVRFSCMSYRELVHQTASYQRNVMRFYDGSEIVRALKDKSEADDMHGIPHLQDEIEQFQDEAAIAGADDDGEFPY